jgi:hypothetical protein
VCMEMTMNKDRPPSALANVELLGRIMQDLNYMIDVRGNTQLAPALVLVKQNKDEFEMLRRMARAMEATSAPWDDEDGAEEPHLCYMGHENCWDEHINERLADEADWKS